MQKDGAVFHDYSVEFDAGMQIANINVNTAFEAGKTYQVGVTEFTDNDGSTVKAAENSFTAMSTIELESIEINSGSDWQQVSGSSDIALTVKNRAVFSLPVEPEAVKLLDKDGNEITDTIITNKTSEKNKIIAFHYDGFYPMTNYSIAVAYTHPVTGQSVENSTVSFITSVPDHLVLADTTQPNSEDNPYLIYCAAALDQTREDEYLAKNYYFKQMADIDLSPSEYKSDNNTRNRQPKRNLYHRRFNW